MILSACGLVTQDDAQGPSGIVEVRLIGFNDFHGNLEPISINVPDASGTPVAVPAGGAAYFASAIASLKAANPNHAVISAGDLISASPLVSALFLDEPTIEAMNLIGIDFNAVGNHEFDRGQAELLRMQHGGCAKHTAREPCQGSGNFPGANFAFLAANTVKSDGRTLFPATAMKNFTSGSHTVKIGFIGLTLKGTPASVTPTGVAGLTFADEAQTANALIPGLREAGAQAIVVVIHEGGYPTGGFNNSDCRGMTGGIVPILDKLDPSVDVVITGHTHRAYVCDYADVDPAKPFLLTSAGQYGTLLTAIDLKIDAVAGRVIDKRARNIIVQGAQGETGNGAPNTVLPTFASHPGVQALVARYVKAAAPLANRPVGRITASIHRRFAPSREHALGNLIADSQLAATRRPDKGGAQIALMNPGGVRTDLNFVGEGAISYGQVFSVLPFGNHLVVKSFSGAQIRRLLEAQWASGANSLATPRVLLPSAGFRYAYDLRKPAGQRVSDITLNGVPLQDGIRYRVAMNDFLASGGDNFSVFNEGTDVVGGENYVDALIEYLASNSPVAPPALDRITRIDR
ncbi:MAG: bifunctional metallophosphatase/5'-nucleotidase [Burkholderiales bacterium]